MKKPEPPTPPKHFAGSLLEARTAIRASLAAEETSLREHEQAALVLAVLDTLIPAYMVGRDRALKVLAQAARQAFKFLPGRPNEDSPRKFAAELEAMISSPELPRGADAETVAQRLGRWLDAHDWMNAIWASDDLGLDGSLWRRENWDHVRKAIPARYVDDDGRVFVPRSVAHRAGAPKKRQSVCMCVKCAARQIMGAAVDATGLRFPDFRPPKKEKRKKRK